MEGKSPAFFFFKLMYSSEKIATVDGRHGW